MKKTRRSKNKKMTDAEIELFCQSVEDVLGKIKDRSASKKGKKAKVKVKVKAKEKKVIIYKDDLVLEDGLVPLEEEQLTF